MAEIYDENPKRILGIEPVITSVAEAELVHNSLIRYRSYLFFSGIMDGQPHYRGEQNFGWDVRPGLFRGGEAHLSSSDAKVLEMRLVGEFEREITTLFSSQALRHLFDGETYGRKWDNLFQAQHAGIRTTIVDFSFHWERALFFAVEESSLRDIEAADAQFWAYLYDNERLLKHSTVPLRDTYYDQDPECLASGRMVNVPFYLSEIENRIFEGRMYKQVGRFYIPSRDKCSIPLNHQEDIAPWLFRFRIPAACKAPIREELKAMGLDRDYLYVKENPEHQAIVTQINQRICGW
ncbi:FRG domain-containing protein [Chitinophaga sp. OAE865]|uniref:FRG domain-containing protein n=1 Tax=Chitinophaga sp. OAE865 TaxID=2817898 RepID=UPI001AE6429B